MSTPGLRRAPWLLAAALLLPPEPQAACAPSLSQGDAAGDQSAARAHWERMCAATLLRSSRDAEPVTALDLRFNLLTRGDQGSNELKPRVRWLADSRIRFELGSGRELGRGPDGDWLRDGDEVVRFAGREYAEDRRQIDEYLTIVQDFVALTHPTTLDIENLALIDEVTFEFPKRHPLDKPRLRKRLTWLSFESADLLLPGEHGWAGAFGEKHRIFVAIDGESHLPVMAMIFAREGQSAPMLLHLSNPKVLDDLRVPHQIHVYPVRPAAPGGPVRWIVAEHPSQEFYILGGTLRARLSDVDFALPRD